MQRWEYQAQVYDDLKGQWVNWGPASDYSAALRRSKAARCYGYREKVVRVPLYAVDEDPRVGPTVNALQPDAATYKARVSALKRLTIAGLNIDRILFVRWLILTGRVSDGEKAAAPAR